MTFNKSDNGSLFSDSFIYKMNPLDYISLTREILKNRNLFSEIDKIKAVWENGHSLNETEISSLNRFAALLDRHKNSDTGSEQKMFPNELFKDFETYKYYFKEIGASLKFNPLSKSDAGKHVLEKLLHFIEKYNGLISPKVIFRNIEVKPDENGLSVIGTRIHFDNKKLVIFSTHSSVKDNKEISPEDLNPKNVIVYVVTIGPGVDHEIKHLMEEGEMFDAYLLNGIGAGTTEMVANDLNRYMNDLNTEVNYVYRRLSPGYGDWNVSDQTKIFKLLNPEKYIGVKLTDTHIMLPEKSTSGIMGLTLKERKI